MALADFTMAVREDITKSSSFSTPRIHAGLCKYMSKETGTLVCLSDSLDFSVSSIFILIMVFCLLNCSNRKSSAPSAEISVQSLLQSASTASFTGMRVLAMLSASLNSSALIPDYIFLKCFADAWMDVNLSWEHSLKAVPSHFDVKLWFEFFAMLLFDIFLEHFNFYCTPEYLAFFSDFSDHFSPFHI